VLALLLALLAAAQYHADRSPQATARRYFTALARGDAAAALGYAATPPRGPYLTATVLRQQLAVAALTGLQVEGIRPGNLVEIKYQLQFASGVEQVNDLVPMVRYGSSWRLARAAVEVRVAGTDDGFDRLTFAGGRMPSKPVLVFPGALPLSADRPAVRLAGQPSAPLSGQHDEVQLSTELTPAAIATARQTLSAALTACLTGRSVEPRCPVAGDRRPVPGSLRGTAAPFPTPPTVTLLSGGLVELTGTVSVHGHWQDWDFNNQPVAESGISGVDLQAQASVDDLHTLHWMTG